MLAMGQHLDDLAERYAVEMNLVTFLCLVLEATNYNTMLIINCSFLSFSDCSYLWDEQRND